MPKGHRDVQGEDPLSEVIRLPRSAAHEIAQGPLREQQERKRQHKTPPRW